MKCQDYQKVIGLTDPSKIQSLKQVCLFLAQQWKREEVSPFTQLIKGLIQNFSRNILVSFQKKACVCVMHAKQLWKRKLCPYSQGRLKCRFITDRIYSIKICSQPLGTDSSHTTILISLLNWCTNDSGSPRPLCY